MKRINQILEQTKALQPKTVIRIVLISICVLTIISLPIVRWTLGVEALYIGIINGVLVQASLVVFILFQDWGWKRTITTTVGIVLSAWIAEWIGINNGVLFGVYHYTNFLQPQLLEVPLQIPLAWMMMLPPSWAVAAILLKSLHIQSPRWSRVIFIGLSMLAFTFWDFFLDPQMVAWQFWSWDQPGGYFGIPWQNYLGWLVVSGLITAILGRVDLPILPLLVIYSVTWVLQTIGQIFYWGLPGPALVGFFTMGTMVVLAWIKIKETK
jgi:uncharacterized membrane protein